jgi:ComEC/Rec2-related protein
VQGALGRIWSCVAGLVLGIMYADTYRPPGWASMLVCGAGAACVAARRRPLVSFAGLVLVAFGAGAVASARRADDAALTTMASGAPSCSFQGEIHEHLGGLGTLVALDRVRCDGYLPVTGAGLVVMDEPTGDPGAKIAGRGLLVGLDDDSFDGQRGRMGALAVLHPFEVELGRVRSPPLAVAAAVRRGLDRATESIEARRAGLVRGLTTGDVSGLDPGTIERFQRAGLSHLLAVSGSNVAIVLGAVGVLVSRLGPRWKLGLGAAALGIFVLVVGPEPSVLRAAAMGAIGLAALASGRRSEPLHALGVALVIVLAARPAMVYLVGLHLSVAATGGIVLWSHAVARHLSWLPRWAALGGGATIAAQIAVAPVLVVAFGRLSLAGPAANLLALPAVPPATVLGVTAGVVGAVWPDAGAVAARLAEPLAAWVLWVGDAFGESSWAAIDLARWTGWAAAVPVIVAVHRSLAIRSTNPLVASAADTHNFPNDRGEEQG